MLLACGRPSIVRKKARKGLTILATMAKTILLLRALKESTASLFLNPSNSSTRQVLTSKRDRSSYKGQDQQIDFLNQTAALRSASLYSILDRNRNILLSTSNRLSFPTETKETPSRSLTRQVTLTVNFQESLKSLGLVMTTMTTRVIR